MAADLCALSIAEVSRLLRARKVSPTELTHAYLERIETFQPQIDAFITVTADLARSQARRAEREIRAGDYRGPMHGVPFGLKDIYDTRGIPTTGGSRLCIDNRPARDSACTRKLYDARAILLGKLQTHEFAHGGPSFDLPWPPARNPWHLEHFTGGSSSGSGAAVAAGLVAGALGSDTGGSIRGPASYCGIVGMMSSAGLVSRAGVIPNSFTLDHCGPMTRTVEDCAIMLQAIAGHDPLDGGSIEVKVPSYRANLKKGIKGLRIGVLRHVWEKDVPQSAAVASAMDRAIEVLRKLGARTEVVQVRPALQYSDVKVVLAETEIYTINYPDLVARPGDFGEDFLSRALPACLFQSSDYVAASREQRRMIEEMTPLWQRYDALLSVVFGPAPRLDAHHPLNFWARPNANPMANVLGCPSLALCNGFSAGGLPHGMQIMGRPFDEATVLRVGYAYEQATEWHRRRPPLVAGAAKPKLAPPAHQPGAPDLDSSQVDLVRALARKAGLRLNERQMGLLLEAAPYALAMADRVRRMHDRSFEPCNVFRFPASVGS
ncbi:MAG: amidase [Betaproteobacteria bacterium]|nr:MAG: amidase [Betaproteobacteria bacterium]